MRLRHSLILVGSLLGVAHSALAGQPPDELVKALSGFQGGALEAVYLPDSGFAEFRVGFDPATGAWYRADQRGMIGRDTAGTYYGGESGLGRSKALEVTGDSQPAYIAGFCPPALVWQMLNDPGFVVGAQRAGEVWAIDVQYPDTPGPGGAPIHIPPVHVEYDQAAGQITRMYRDDRLDHQSRFEYGDPEAARLHMPSHLQLGGLHLASVNNVDNTHDAFSRERVESVSAQVKLNVQTALATSQNSSRQKVAENNSSREQPAIEPRARAYRNAFLIGGGIFLVIGLAFWFWKRRS